MENDENFYSVCLANEDFGQVLFSSVDAFIEYEQKTLEAFRKKEKHMREIINNGKLTVKVDEDQVDALINNLDEQYGIACLPCKTTFKNMRTYKKHLRSQTHNKK